MSHDNTQDELLQQLEQITQRSANGTPTHSAATTVAPRPRPPTARPSSEGELDALLDRIHGLTSEPTANPPSPTTQHTAPAMPNPVPSPAGSQIPVAPLVIKAPGRAKPGTLLSRDSKDLFIPKEPSTLAEANISQSAVEELILKYLMTRGEDTIQGISDQIKLPFKLITDIASRLKYEQLIQYRGTTSMNDYVSCLTDKGRDRARRLSQVCTYYGAAPVTLKEYCDSVALQSLQQQHPGIDDLRAAFADLLINPKMLVRLGAAVNSGRGMFLFGFPGNGKTSIAERVTKAFGEAIWIPRSIGIDGDIIRVFDPSQHDELPLEEAEGLICHERTDRRWVRIRRPTIVVGGELQMDHLELTVNGDTGINEAPVQLKSNCGTLVIDDFGRQRMSTDELLNRWIVPLEKRFDYLNLPSGKKIEVPFDQLVVFSTNLEPKDLVDDAFLRRIPYKIEVENPTEEEFRKLFRIMSPKMGFEYDEGAIDYLIEKHYKPINRPFRCCHPRDLLMQVTNYCRFMRRPMKLTQETLGFAVGNYFAVM